MRKTREVEINLPPVGKVRRLSEEMIRGIAAGEVVQRPASVLKELIENSLDAGARRIDVEWQDAGKKRLRVVDDGEGMSADDARLSLERHATSKITSLDDLDRISTFGFRGEALPSIMAVSRFEMVTRPRGSDQAWRIRAEGGVGTFDGPAGAPPGTSITADDLFFAVPARLKFLKSDATERSLLSRTVEDAALAGPRVSFRVVSEGKELFHLPALVDESRLTERLEILWGDARARSFVPVREEGKMMSVVGWVSDINHSESSARYQRFFVNHRPVTSRRLLHALYEGYKSRLPLGRHPAALLFIGIDPTQVDVNVHPAKREVRLSHENEVHDFLFRAVQKSLGMRVHVLGINPSEIEVVEPPSFRPHEARNWPARPEFHPTTTSETMAAFRLQSPRPSMGGGEGAPGGGEGEEGISLDAFREAAFVPVAQLYSTYILARLENQFFLFDQHAAAERVLYETLLDQAQRGAVAKQNLMLAWVWDPSAEASTVVEANRAEFEKLGFTLEPFGGKSWRIGAVPAALTDGHRAQSLLEGLVEDLLLGRIPRGWDALLTRAACRGSVKAGAHLSTVEMGALLRDLQRSPRPWTCPHGRPAFLRFSDADLAKRFRRT